MDFLSQMRPIDWFLIALVLVLSAVTLWAIYRLARAVIEDVQERRNNRNRNGGA